jgi:transposase
VRDIRRATCRQHSTVEKIRIVIAGLRGHDSVAEVRRKKGINQKSVLPSVEGLPGGEQEVAGGRY